VCADENKQMKEAMVSSKVEAISLEYNHLLATQLDSQRQYFEGLLVQQDAKQQAAVAAAKAAAEQAQAASEAAAGSAKESERKRQQMERRLVSWFDCRDTRLFM
jgi:BRCA1-associated protein